MILQPDQGIYSLYWIFCTIRLWITLFGTKNERIYAVEKDMLCNAINELLNFLSRTSVISLYNMYLLYGVQGVVLLDPLTPITGRLNERLLWRLKK